MVECHYTDVAVFRERTVETLNANIMRGCNVNVSNVCVGVETRRRRGVADIDAINFNQIGRAYSRGIG